MYRVLIVDDQKLLRYDLKRMNVWGETSGFQIEGEAVNGLEAFKMLKKSFYDLVITDIRMPVMDGIDLLKKISEEELCPCVVLLSDYTEFSYAREGLVHGAFDYMAKPLEPQSLKELLARAKVFLDNKKQERERLKGLENLAEEAFLPSQDVDEITGLLCGGENEAIKAAKRMVESVGAALNYDLNRSAIILKNSLEMILTGITKEHDWISLYADPNEFKQTDLVNVKSFEILWEEYIEALKHILSFIKKMVIWDGTNTLVKSACHQVLYHVEADISVKSIAQKLYISKTYLSELFKQSTGTSLLEYINMVKMEKAKFLLRTSILKSYEIAERLGFKDHEYFSKIFKKYTSITPIRYRKENLISDRIRVNI